MSNIDTSTYCPSPVRSRQSSAARIAEVAFIAAAMSITGLPVRIGIRSGSPVSEAKPLSALEDRVEPRLLRMAPLRAVGVERTVDQLRPHLPERRVVEPQPPHHARREVLDHHVRRPHQVLRHLRPGRRREIEAKALLPAIEPEEVRALAVDLRRLVGARLVADPGRLDLDHLGAHVRQRLGAGRPREVAREIHDADPVQGRSRRAGRPRLVGWKAAKRRLLLHLFRHV